MVASALANHYMQQSLKRTFVIECKKQKLKYGMNDIIKTIRPVTSVQMKLF